MQQTTDIILLVEKKQCSQHAAPLLTEKYAAPPSTGHILPLTLSLPHLCRVQSPHPLPEGFLQLLSQEQAVQNLREVKGEEVTGWARPQGACMGQYD